MKVRAIQPGFYGGSLQAAGSTFEVKDAAELGKWMEPIPEPKPAKAKAEKAEPAKADDLT